MQFRIKVCQTMDVSKWHWENYDKDFINNVVEAEVWGREIVKYFNTTLRPGEKNRRFLCAEMFEWDFKKRK